MAPITRKNANDWSPRQTRNLLLLSYDLEGAAVRNVSVVPKHFFVPDIVERTQAAGRIPLGEPAGSDQTYSPGRSLNQGRIQIVRGGRARTQGTSAGSVATYSLSFGTRAWRPEAG